MTIPQYKILYDMAERGCRIICVGNVYYLFDKDTHHRIQTQTVAALDWGDYIKPNSEYLIFRITRKGRNAVQKFRDQYQLACCEYHVHRFPECFIKIRKTK